MAVHFTEQRESGIRPLDCDEIVIKLHGLVVAPPCREARVHQRGEADGFPGLESARLALMQDAHRHGNALALVVRDPRRQRRGGLDEQAFRQVHARLRRRRKVLGLVDVVLPGGILEDEAINAQRRALAKRDDDKVGPRALEGDPGRRRSERVIACRAAVPQLGHPKCLLGAQVHRYPQRIAARVNSVADDRQRVFALRQVHPKGDAGAAPVHDEGLAARGIGIVGQHAVVRPGRPRSPFRDEVRTIDDSLLAGAVNRLPGQLQVVLVGLPGNYRVSDEEVAAFPPENLPLPIAAVVVAHRGARVAEARQVRLGQERRHARLQRIAPSFAQHRQHRVLGRIAGEVIVVQQPALPALHELRYRVAVVVQMLAPREAVEQQVLPIGVPVLAEADLVIGLLQRHLRGNERLVVVGSGLGVLVDLLVEHEGIDPNEPVRAFGLDATLVGVLPRVVAILLHEPLVAGVLCPPQRQRQHPHRDIRSSGHPRIPEPAGQTTVVADGNHVVSEMLQIAAGEVLHLVFGEAVDGCVLGREWQVAVSILLGLPRLRLRQEAGLRLRKHLGHVRQLVVAMEVTRAEMAPQQRECGMVPGDEIAPAQASVAGHVSDQVARESQERVAELQPLVVGHQRALLKGIPGAGDLPRSGLFVPGEHHVSACGGVVSVAPGLVELRDDLEGGDGLARVRLAAGLEVLVRVLGELAQRRVELLRCDLPGLGIAHRRLGPDLRDVRKFAILYGCQETLHPEPCPGRVAAPDDDDVVPPVVRIGIVDGVQQVLAGAGSQSVGERVAVPVQALNQRAIEHVAKADDGAVCGNGGLDVLRDLGTDARRAKPLG